jgi:hypothetical protein
MVSNQELLANKEGPLSTTICSQTAEESKGNRNINYPPTEATGETAKIYYSPVEPEMGLKVDSNENYEVGREASHWWAPVWDCGDRGLFAFYLFIFFALLFAF